MKNYSNDGSFEYILQNEFTAYLQTAIRRVKVRYLQRKNLILSKELPEDFLYDENSASPIWWDAIFYCAPGMGNNLVVKVHYALGSRKR